MVRVRNINRIRGHKRKTTSRLLLNTNVIKGKLVIPKDTEKPVDGRSLRYNK